MTEPKPPATRARARYSVYMGTHAAFILDARITDRDPVVRSFSYVRPNGIRDRADAERKAFTVSGNMNRLDYLNRGAGRSEEGKRYRARRRVT